MDDFKKSLIKSDRLHLQSNLKQIYLILLDKLKENNPNGNYMCEDIATLCSFYLHYYTDLKSFDTRVKQNEEKSKDVEE